jgi:TRAP-type C4-dicarboxylate transport system substrate-binding protein
MATSAKTIDTKIIDYLSVLNVEEKKAVLSVVETFAKESNQSADFWDELSKEQQVAIDRAIKEADAGKLTSHKMVMKKLRKL